MRQNRDVYGGYLLCVQCGHYLTDSEIYRLRRMSGRGVAADAGRRERPAA